MQSTQSPRLPTPRSSKLQPRRIAHLTDLLPQRPPFRAQQRFRNRFPSHPKPSQHHLQTVNLIRQSLLLHPANHIRRQLIRCFIRPSRCFLKANVPRRKRYQTVAIGGCEGDVGVVFCGVDVEMVCFLLIWAAVFNVV